MATKTEFGRRQNSVLVTQTRFWRPPKSSLATKTDLGSRQTRLCWASQKRSDDTYILHGGSHYLHLCRLHSFAILWLWTTSSPYFCGWRETPILQGKSRLDNGKSTIAVLKELQHEYNSTPVADREKLEWACGDLYAHITSGILLEQVTYPEEHDLQLIVAWQVLRHDEASNQNWSKSTIEDKIRVAEAAKQRVEGGNEAAAVKLVLTMYGNGFRSRVYQWFLLARCVDPAARQYLKGLKDVNQQWIIDNKFLTGENHDAKFKMTAPMFSKGKLTGFNTTGIQD